MHMQGKVTTKAPNKTRIIVEIPATHKKRLLKKAGENGTTYSHIIRDLVGQWMKQEKTTDVKRTTPSKKTTASASKTVN